MNAWPTRRKIDGFSMKIAVLVSSVTSYPTAKLTTNRVVDDVTIESPFSSRIEIDGATTLSPRTTRTFARDSDPA